MMRSVRRTLDPRLGACATVVAAFVLHQLRYALVPDRAADAAHEYLGWAPQILAGVASLSIGMALVHAVRAPARPERPVRSRARMAVERLDRPAVGGGVRLGPDVRDRAGPARGGMDRAAPAGRFGAAASDGRRRGAVVRGLRAPVGLGWSGSARCGPGAAGDGALTQPVLTINL
jgi:hypothetical protein